MGFISRPVRHASSRLQLVDVEGARTSDLEKEGLHLRVELGPAVLDAQARLVAVYNCRPAHQ